MQNKLTTACRRLPWDLLLLSNVVRHYTFWHGAVRERGVEELWVLLVASRVAMKVQPFCCIAAARCLVSTADTAHCFVITHFFSTLCSFTVTYQRSCCQLNLV